MDAAEAHEATPNQDGDPNMTPEIPTAAAVDGETEINDDGEDPKDSLSRLQKGVGWRLYQKKHSGGPAAATRFGWRGGGALPRQPQQQQQHEEEEKDHHHQQQQEEENTNGALSTSRHRRRHSSGDPGSPMTGRSGILHPTTTMVTPTPNKPALRGGPSSDTSRDSFGSSQNRISFRESRSPDDSVSSARRLFRAGSVAGSERSLRSTGSSRVLDSSAHVALKAAGEGDLAAVRAFLDSGGDVNAKSKTGQSTALSRAASRGHLDIVHLLLEREAAVNLPGRGGMTPLHEAAGCGQLDACYLLLGAGAAVAARDHARRTPLHYAGSSADVTQLLLDFGADPEAKDKNDKKPDSMAVNAEARALLKDARCIVRESGVGDNASRVIASLRRELDSREHEAVAAKSVAEEEAERAKAQQAEIEGLREKVAALTSELVQMRRDADELAANLKIPEAVEMELRQARAALRVARAAAAEEKSHREALEAKFESSIASAIATALAEHDEKRLLAEAETRKASLKQQQQQDGEDAIETTPRSANGGRVYGADDPAPEVLLPPAVAAANDGGELNAVLENGGSIRGIAGGGEASVNTVPVRVVTPGSTRILTNRQRDKHFRTAGRSGNEGQSAEDVESEATDFSLSAPTAAVAGEQNTVPPALCPFPPPLSLARRHHTPGSSIRFSALGGSLEAQAKRRLDVESPIFSQSPTGIVASPGSEESFSGDARAGRGELGAAGATAATKNGSSCPSDGALFTAEQRGEGRRAESFGGFRRTGVPGGEATAETRIAAVVPSLQPDGGMERERQQKPSSRRDVSPVSAAIDGGSNTRKGEVSEGQTGEKEQLQGGERGGGNGGGGRGVNSEAQEKLLVRHGSNSDLGSAVSLSAVLRWAPPSPLMPTGGTIEESGTSGASGSTRGSTSDSDEWVSCPPSPVRTDKEREDRVRSLSWPGHGDGNRAELTVASLVSMLLPMREAPSGADSSRSQPEEARGLEQVAVGRAELEGTSSDDSDHHVTAVGDNDGDGGAEGGRSGDVGVGADESDGDCHVVEGIDLLRSQSMPPPEEEVVAATTVSDRERPGQAEAQEDGDDDGNNPRRAGVSGREPLEKEGPDSGGIAGSSSSSGSGDGVAESGDVRAAAAATVAGSLSEGGEEARGRRLMTAEAAASTLWSELQEMKVRLNEVSAENSQLRRSLRAATSASNRSGSSSRKRRASETAPPTVVPTRYGVRSSHFAGCKRGTSAWTGDLQQPVPHQHRQQQVCGQEEGGSKMKDGGIRRVPYLYWDL